MGQVTHLNSTPFLPISIVLHCQAKPHSPATYHPLCHISPPLTLQRHFPTPTPQHPPHPSSLLNEKFPPPQSCIFATPCSCLSPGFSYSGNSPLSLTHRLATSPTCIPSRARLFPLFCPISTLALFFCLLRFSFPNHLPHMDPHATCSAAEGCCLPACPSAMGL